MGISGAHGAMHRVRAKNVGLVGQVGQVGRLAQGAVRAMCSGNSQSAWHTACHSPFIVFPEFIVFIASLPAPCALRNVLCQSSGGSRARQGDSRQSPRPMFGRSGTFAAASRWECALLFFERYAHGARGETSLFPPCTPFSPRVLYRGLRHAMRLL